MSKLFPFSKNISTTDDQSADFVELFFDLIFVYAITRITALTAHHLDAFHVLQSVLIFWLIWWGWTQFTWSLNDANTRIAQVRLLVLSATGVAFVMASSVGEAFKEGVLWFILPYIIIRVIGIGLAIRVTVTVNKNITPIILFTIPSIIAWILLIVGALVDPPQRIWWWIIAIVFDMLAGYLGGRASGWDLKPKHFAERHGLIVIIALGESLIVAANAISTQGLSQGLIIVGGLAVVVTCLLWWSYFSWINEHLEEHLSKQSGTIQAQLARDAYSLIHFPLICGIIGIAVGFEKILMHPGDLLSLPVAAALFTGYLLFIGSTAASVWRLSKVLLAPRLIILLITAALATFSVNQPAYLAFGIIAVSLVLIIQIEWKKCRHV